MTALKIAVALPSFSRDLKVLKRCLNSIEAQIRRPDVVAISISSTQIKDIEIDTYSFPIRWVITNLAQGSSKNRNFASSLCYDCDIISFFDTDDVMLPERLLYIERAFNENNSDYIIHNYVLLKHPDHSSEPKYTEYKAYTELELNSDSWAGVMLKKTTGIMGYSIAQGHMSIRRKIIDTLKYDENNTRYEDGAFIRTMFHNGLNGSYLYTQLSVYHHY